MKICIISNSHLTSDVRLYHKLAQSLAQKAETYVISGKGMINKESNPYQIIVDAESPNKNLPALYRECLRLKPDILIPVEPLTVPVALLLRRRLGCRVVWDIHEFFAHAHAERYQAPFRPLMRFAYLMYERVLARRVDGIIAVNQGILQQLLPGKISPKKHIVLPNYPVAGVWENNQDIPHGLSDLCKMKFDLIYIGGISKDRGILQLLKAATLLKKDYPLLKILIVGKFADEGIQREFNNSVSNYNLNRTIFYQEWVPADKVGLLLKRSRFGIWFFNPSNWRMRQGPSLKVLEYLAAGLPVISIKTSLMQGLIHHNELGALSPSFRAQDIAQTIIEMLRLSDEEYAAMSARCVEISQTRFIWESLEPALFGLIDRLS